MTTVANIAQRILDENGYELADFDGLTLTILEYKIDDAIDYVNLQAGLTIADLAGTAESKSITGTDGQILAVKWLSNLMLKAYAEKGYKEQPGMLGLSVSYILNDPDYKATMMIIELASERLKELPIVIKNDPLPNEQERTETGAIWNTLLAAFERQWGSMNVTRRALSLGSRDSTTGWRAKTYNPTTIKMIIVPRGATKMIQAAGAYPKTDAAGMTNTAVALGDEVKTSGNIYYEIEGVEEAYSAPGTVEFYRCDLTKMPLHE